MADLFALTADTAARLQRLLDSGAGRGKGGVRASDGWGLPAAVVLCGNPDSEHPGLHFGTMVWHDGTDWQPGSASDVLLGHLSGGTLTADEVYHAVGAGRTEEDVPVFWTGDGGGGGGGGVGSTTALPAPVGVGGITTLSGSSGTWVSIYPGTTPAAGLYQITAQLMGALSGNVAQAAIYMRLTKNGSALTLRSPVVITQTAGVTALSSGTLACVEAFSGTDTLGVEAMREFAGTLTVSNLYGPAAGGGGWASALSLARLGS